MLSGPTPRRARRASSSISAAPHAVDLHHPATGEALAEVLVGGEDAHLLDLVAEARGGRGERVVRLELAHGPDRHPQ